MKRRVAFIVFLCLLLSMCGCSKEKTSTNDYQYMYDGIMKDWNQAATGGHELENLFGYGEYLYNSYLLLFPRETPSSLRDYYFHWEQGIDVDNYAISFTCRPNEKNYAAFCKGLNDFSLQNGNTSIKPIYDTVHFPLPAYILQWQNVGENWEVLEYILLDDETHTAIFVYTMGSLDLIEKHTNNSVNPTDMHFLTEDFSIYEDFQESAYDISFLAFLN